MRLILKVDFMVHGIWNEKGSLSKVSYHSASWQKEIGKGSWVFHLVLKTFSKVFMVDALLKIRCQIWTFQIRLETYSSKVINIIFNLNPKYDA